MNERKIQKTNKPHTNLFAWQKSMDLVVTLYKVTSQFPKEEIYGLVAQIRRAAVSAPSNIAEGACGRSQDVFKNHLSIAIGSLNELLTQTEIAFRLAYIPKNIHEQVATQLDECLALVYGLRKSL